MWRGKSGRIPLRGKTTVFSYATRYIGYTPMHRPSINDRVSVYFVNINLGDVSGFMVHVSATKKGFDVSILRDRYKRQRRQFLYHTLV